jgi:hypothetical protein
MTKILLGWEIILALLSFVFYKVMKFIIGNVFTLYLILNKKQASQWRVLSQKTINAPLVLPVLMTKGPRWNTHAVIGTLGPFAVKESIEINIETANNSARSWIAVVYSFPAYKTITNLESEQINQDNRSQEKNNHPNYWQKIKLSPGKYSLGVRFYNPLDTITYPAVKVDGQLYVESASVPNNINDYYYDLIKAKNWFYSSLHYYIFTILKLRRYLPESFVRREYLPVGAPATHFAYNYLESKQALQINLNSEIIEQFDVYFTLYDRSSLPLTWCLIDASEYQLPPQAKKGYFLLRIRPKPEHSTTDIQVQSQLTKLDNSIQCWQVRQSTAIA